MKRIFIFAGLIFMLAIVSYFVWSFKDKDLKSVPINADVVVLIDVKKYSEQYILTLLKHPSKSFVTSKASFKNNGIKVPDYIQIFHLKNTGFSEWYIVFEISDNNSFLKFLKIKGFKSKDGFYTKGQFSIKMADSKCIVGFSNPAFDKTTKDIINSKNRKLNADELIKNSIASVSYLAKSRIHNFAVYLNDDNIEVKTEIGRDLFSPMISDLKKQITFLKLNLDSRNAKIACELFNKKLSDSINISSVSAIAELEQVNDKIISYSYDENFNEVERVSYHKILQPNYIINFQSWDVEKTRLYFQQKNWINAQNQFTLIPFQPNLIKKETNVISVLSTRKPIGFGKNLSGNYVFIENNQLLLNSIKTLSKSEKKAISKIDYLFYANKEEDYYLKLKFKKQELPIILRW